MFILYAILSIAIIVEIFLGIIEEDESREDFEQIDKNWNKNERKEKRER